MAGRPSLFALAVTAIIIVVCYVPQGNAREFFRARNVTVCCLRGKASIAASPSSITAPLCMERSTRSEPRRGDVVPRQPQEPLTYYHRASPIGEVFTALAAPGCPLRVGIVGLGAGSLAAYARAGDEFEFYEIDPAVIAAAEGSSLLVPGRRSTARRARHDRRGRRTVGARQAHGTATRPDRRRCVFLRRHSLRTC
jgi:hypothetical protein